MLSLACSLLALASRGPGSSPGATFQKKTVLWGRVQARNGKRLAGARVRILSQADPALGAGSPELMPVTESWSVQSNARGGFRVGVPAGRLYRVWAEGPSGREVSAVRHEIRPGDPLRLRMMPAARLRLVPRSRGEWDGPVAFSLLGFDRERRQEFLLLRGLVEAGQGESIPALPPGRYRILLRTRDARAFAGSFQLGPRSRLVLTPKLLAPATLELELPAGMAGEVLLPPALRYPAPEPLRNRLSLPALGLVVGLRVRLKDRQTFFKELPPLQPGQRVRLGLDAVPGRTLGLRCLDRAGEPVGRNGRVLLLWRHGGRIERRLLLPGGGDLDIAGLPPVDLLALYSDGAGGQAAHRIPAAGDFHELRSEAAAGLGLRVFDQDGEPQQEARLLLEPLDLPSARGLEDLHPRLVFYPRRDGRIRVPSLVPGEYLLQVTSPRHVPVKRRIQLRPGERAELGDLLLERGFRLHGKVVGSDGKPAPNVLVSLGRVLGGERGAPVETVADEHGRYSFTGLGEGSYLVEARRQRGPRTELARCRCLPGPAEIVLKLLDEDPLPPEKRRN
ncbi:MAG: carboxypeptidase-like regulatory domain-containing protein [Planctomycetota bacterium]